MSNSDKVLKGLICCQSKLLGDTSLICRGCPYDSISAEMAKCRNALLNDVFELLADDAIKDNNVPDKNVGKWISVKDRLPEILLRSIAVIVEGR